MVSKVKFILLLVCITILVDCIGQNSKLKQPIFILSDTSYISLVFQNFREGNIGTEIDFIYSFGEQTRVHTIINNNNYLNTDTTFTLNTIQLNTVETIYRWLLNKDIKCDSIIFAGDWVSYVLKFSNIKINGTFKGSFSLFDKIKLLK